MGGARRASAIRHRTIVGFVAGLLSAGVLWTPGAARALEEFDCDTAVPASTMQLFDGHDHLRVANLAEAQADLATLAAQGVSLGMLALGTLDPAELAIALALQSSGTDVVFAYVNPLHVAGPGGEKTFDATTLAFVQAQLDAGARGIGETILRHSGPAALAANIPANQAVAMDLYAEAAARGVPVSIHFETRDKSAPDTDIASRVLELRSALSTNPETIFIWAHLGDTGPTLVRTLIEDYTNLYADLSSRNPYFVRGWPVEHQSLSGEPMGTGSLDPDWKQLFEDHPDRFLIGLDLASEDRWSQLVEVVSYYRGVLGELSQEAAEKIACKNARALLVATAVPGPGGSWVVVLGVLMLVTGAGALVHALERS